MLRLQLSEQRTYALTLHDILLNLQLSANNIKMPQCSEPKSTRTMKNNVSAMDARIPFRSQSYTANVLLQNLLD